MGEISGRGIVAASDASESGGIISMTLRHNRLDMLIAVWLAAQAVHEGRQPEQTIDAERAPTRRDNRERILTNRVGPTRRQREQPTVLSPAVDPILAPIAPMNDELEVTTEQRMEPMDHPDTSEPIILIRCS